MGQPTQLDPLDNVTNSRVAVPMMRQPREVNLNLWWSVITGSMVLHLLVIGLGWFLLTRLSAVQRAGSMPIAIEFIELDSERADMADAARQPSPSPVDPAIPSSSTEQPSPSLRADSTPSPSRSAEPTIEPTITATQTPSVSPQPQPESTQVPVEPAPRPSPPEVPIQPADPLEDLFAEQPDSTPEPDVPQDLAANPDDSPPPNQFPSEPPSEFSSESPDELPNELPTESPQDSNPESPIADLPESNDVEVGQIPDSSNLPSDDPWAANPGQDTGDPDSDLPEVTVSADPIPAQIEARITQIDRRFTDEFTDIPASIPSGQDQYTFSLDPTTSTCRLNPSDLAYLGRSIRLGVILATSSDGAARVVEEFAGQSYPIEVLRSSGSPSYDDLAVCVISTWPGVFNPPQSDEVAPELSAVTIELEIDRANGNDEWL